MLVVKVNGNVSDIFNEIDLGPEILNRLVMINFNLSNQEYEMLLKNVVAIISLHRSEGFGRVPAECMLKVFSLLLQTIQVIKIMLMRIIVFLYLLISFQ